MRVARAREVASERATAGGVAPKRRVKPNTHRLALERVRGAAKAEPAQRLLQQAHVLGAVDHARGTDARVLLVLLVPGGAGGRRGAHRRGGGPGPWARARRHIALSRVPDHDDSTWLGGDSCWSAGEEGVGRRWMGARARRVRVVSRRIWVEVVVRAARVRCAVPNLICVWSGGCLRPRALHRRSGAARRVESARRRRRQRPAGATNPNAAHTHTNARVQQAPSSTLSLSPPTPVPLSASERASKHGINLL